LEVLIKELHVKTDSGALKEGKKIHAYIMEEKLDMNVTVCNGVVDMHAKCGFVNKACGVFENMFCRKSLVAYVEYNDYGVCYAW